MPNRKKTEKLYEVEVVLAAEVNLQNEWCYLVKWFGYPESDNSWECMDNFKTCERLLKSFWDHIDCNPEEAHPVGYRVVASAKWIDNEKHYFGQVYGYGGHAGDPIVQNHSTRSVVRRGRNMTERGERGTGLTIKLPRRSVSKKQFYRN